MISGPFQNPDFRRSVAQIFDKVSRRIGEARQRSLVHEAHGERGRREDTDTDTLIDDMETVIKEEVFKAKADIGASGLDIDVEFTANNFTVNKEKMYGADLGIKLRIDMPGFKITKAVLLQSKRMYGPLDFPSFKELATRGGQQAKKMLQMTPASFFLLFNGLPDSLTQFGYHEGVMVLPANRVYAVAQGQKLPGGRLPIDAKYWLQGSMPLGEFIAGLFGFCYVGDTRDEILDLVSSIPPVPLDAPEFPVYKTMNLYVGLHKSLKAF